jgi:hypothetical protein
MSVSRVGAGCGSAIGGVIFLIVGLGMLGFGGWSFLNTRGQMESWGHAEGEIVNFSHYSDSDGGTLTVPVVRYTTADGQEITAEPYEERNTTVDVDGYRVGDTVEVIYNPDNPRDMFLNDFMHVWFVPTLMGGMGGLFGFIGALWAGGAMLGALFIRRPAVARPVVSTPPTGGPPPTITI